MRLSLILFLPAIFVRASLFAQSSGGLIEGITVDSAQNMLNCPADSGQLQIVSIQFDGTTKTKEIILRAELDIKEGDELNAAAVTKRLEANRRRLYNLQLFHWVRYLVFCQDGRLTLIFTMQERWYFWPAPVFSLADRNINAWVAHRDWHRIDYGVHLALRNFRGLNETVSSNVQLGYNQKFELFYTRPAINRKKVGTTLGVSVYRSHAIDYTTQHNELVTLRQDTTYAIQRIYLAPGLLYRPDVQRQTALILTYNWQRISGLALALNSNYYLGRNKRQFAEAHLVHTRNFRNNFSYPLTGSYFQASVTQRVFGNKTGSTSTMLRAKYARYIVLGKNLYYSIGLEGKTTLAQRLAYADNVALGYGSAVVRGYQLYVVGGQQYGLVKQGISRTILPQRELILSFLKTPKFNHLPLSVYLNVFTDAGYARDAYYAAENFFANSLLVSGGIGVHMVTYYDKVITLEYTLNKAGKTGFFINTGIPF